MDEQIVYGGGPKVQHVITDNSSSSSGAVTIADGADVAEGATADAAVAAGAAGTVSAKLRRVTTDLDAVKTSVASIDTKTPASPATSGKQDTGNTSLASIDGKITAVNTGAVVVSSSALPSGAATSAKQDTQITAEQAIQTSVQLIDDAIFAEDVASQAADKGIQVLTVRKDTAAATSGTDGDYQPPVSNARGATWVAIEDGAGGQITSFGGGTQYTEDAAAAANPVGTALILVREDARAGSLTTTDGDNVAARGNNKGELYVIDTDSLAKLTTIDGHVDGLEASNSAIQTAVETIDNFISGSRGLVTEDNSAAIKTSVELIDDAIKADDAAFTPATTKVMMAGFEFDDSSPDSVDEGDAGAARMSARREVYTQIRDAAGNERGLNIDSNGAIAITAAALPSHAVTNAGTFAVQESGTQVQVDDAAFTPATSKIVMAGAEFDDSSPDSVDEGDGGALRMSANRNLYVRVRDNAGNERGLNIDANGALAATVTSATAANLNATVVGTGTFATQESGGALTSLQLIDDIVYTDDTSTHSTGSSKGALMMAAATPTDSAVNANDIGAVAMTTDRKLHVAVMDALPAGSAAIGKLAANSGVDIGDVDVTSIVPGTGATNLGKAEDGGHTTGDVGVFALGVRVDTPNAALTSADADYSPIATNKLGSVRLAPMEDDLATAATAHVKKYYTNSGAVTDGIVWSPAAGKRWFLTHLSFNVSAACTVTFEDDLTGGDSAVYKGEFAANSGAVLTFPEVPMFSGEDAADLLVTTSAGNIYVTAVGYEI